jgi:DNA-binding SARP family transcriptional activator/TolB-like protein
MAELLTHVLSFPEPSSTRFELRCWGEFRLIDRLQGSECLLRRRKARAIIAYLAAHGGGSISRERLSALLWSERGDEQARTSLRQTLVDLRPYTTDASRLLIIDRDQVHLNGLVLTSDIARIEAIARTDKLDALAQALPQKEDRLYGGLDGLDPAFDEWLNLERRAQQDRLLSLGAEAATRGLNQGAHAAVSRLATKLQTLDETNETVAQIGMRADHASDDRSAVRRRYRRLHEALKAELGVSPAPETEVLFGELTGRILPMGAGGASPAAPAEPAVEATAAATAGAALRPSPRPEDEIGELAPQVRGWIGGFRRLSWRSAGGTALAAVLVFLACAEGVTWLLREQIESTPPPPKVAVVPFVVLEADPAGRDFSARLGDQVVGVLKDNVVGLSLVDQPASGAVERTDLRLTGTVSRDGANWRVRTSLEDVPQGVTLWAREFERPPQQESMLQLEVAVAAAEVVDGAIVGLQEKVARRDARLLALVLQSEEAAKSPNLMNPGEPRRLLEEAVARAPDFAGARANLALSLLAESGRGAESDRQPLALRARAQADLAIRSDPAAAGAAYDTRYLMARAEAPDDLAAAENVIIEGSARAPRFPYLYMRRCRFLTEVGLAREALPYCQRALALHPLASPLAYSYAEALYAAGSPEFATRVIQNAVRFHPDHSETRRVQFELAAFSGRLEEAYPLLHRPDFEPCNCTPFTPEATQAMDLFLRARKSGTPQDADKAVAALNAAVRHGKLHPRYLVFGAAALGRLDDAFATLEEISKLPGRMLQGDPGLLFEGPAAPLQRDARFWPLAAKAGYVKYWRTRDVWPDFCSDPSLPYDCRAVAARAAPSMPHRTSR